MLRLANHTDVEGIVDGLLSLKARTGWSRYHQPGYNQQSLREFVTRQLNSSVSVCYVWDAGGVVKAFCGGELRRFNLPPYMPCVLEWGWYGSQREAVRCWQKVRRWGLLRGAELAGRVHPRPATRSNRVIEQVVWEILQ